MSLEQTPLAESGWLRHFTPRDIFYLAGAISMATASWVIIGNRVDLVERDFSRLFAKVEVIDKELVRMNHEGTIASKNGIYQESEASKNNLRRIEAHEDQLKTMSTLLTRIDVNVERLMKEDTRNKTN